MNKIDQNISPLLILDIMFRFQYVFLLKRYYLQFKYGSKIILTHFD